MWSFFGAIPGRNFHISVGLVKSVQDGLSKAVLYSLRLISCLFILVSVIAIVLGVPVFIYLFVYFDLPKSISYQHA